MVCPVPFLDIDPLVSDDEPFSRVPCYLLRMRRYSVPQEGGIPPYCRLHPLCKHHVCYDHILRWTHLAAS